MIFVTVGTHPGQFTRLVKRMDEIASEINEKVIIQKGFTKYVPKNAEFFDFEEDISKYFKKARLVISQAATSVIEFSLNYNKPIILVPRQKKFHEHINDHQVEFAEYFSKKTGTLLIKDMRDLTPHALKNYKKKTSIDHEGLKKLQNYIVSIIEKNNGK